jgi:hypothetical protein
MASLLFTCPKTNQQIPTGIETDVRSLSASWGATLKVACPHCGGCTKIQYVKPISAAPWTTLKAAAAGDLKGRGAHGGQAVRRGPRNEGGVPRP